MPLFITLSEGPRADRTQPVLATGDRRIIAALLREIERLGNRDDAEGDDLPDAPIHLIGRTGAATEARP